MNLFSGRIRFEKLLDQFAVVHERLEEVLRRVSRPQKLPAPPPLVWAIAFGKTDDGTLRALGDAHRATARGSEVTLQTYVPLRDVQLIVFADPERVSIGGLFYGVDLLTLAVGHCPVAFFPRWDVWVKVTVMVRIAEGPRDEQ